MKQCTKCGVSKTLEQFYKNKKSKDGHWARCKTCIDEQQKQGTLTWAQNNKERIRDNSLKRKFGINLVQYSKILENQKECCYICQRHYSVFKKALAVDHAHGESDWIPKGAIRGLLCDNCNRMVIGRNTNADWYERASEYLRQHTGWIVPEKKRTIKRKPK